MGGFETKPYGKQALSWGVAPGTIDPKHEG